MQHSFHMQTCYAFQPLSGWRQIRLLFSLWHNAAFSKYVCSFFFLITNVEYKAIILPEHLSSGYQTSGTTWSLISLMCHKVRFYCTVLFMCTPLGFNNCSVRLCGTVWGQNAPTELQQVLIAVLFMNNGRQSFFSGVSFLQVFCWYERILQVNWLYWIISWSDLFISLTCPNYFP